MTNATFYNYFDENGKLLDNFTDESLTFEGNFSNLGVNSIEITKEIDVVGNGAVLDGISFLITANNVAIDGFTINQNGYYCAIDADDGLSNITLTNNEINFNAEDNANCYAIIALNAENLQLLSNTITYVGVTQGNFINNVVYIKGSKEIILSDNTFNISMPATTAGYDELYNSEYYSDAIVLTGCYDVTVMDNIIDLEYSDYYGSYDSINVLVIGNGNYDMDWETYDFVYTNVCNEVLVMNNKITAKGHNYIYGISVAGGTIDIYENELNISSDYYYVDGIQVNGPSSNVSVMNNNIILEAPGVAYGIYSYQYMGPINNSIYDNNTIVANAYAVCGMEIVENNPTIINNVLYVDGNHTTGMALNFIDSGLVNNNSVSSLGSNVGNSSTGDSLIHEESTAISVKGDAEISSNTVFSTAIGINLLQGGDIALNDNEIQVVVNGTVDNYGVCVNDIDGLNMTNNTIDFEGCTDGTVTSNGMYISKTDDARIEGNTFTLDLVSSSVSWAEVPAGSGKWVSFPVSEGIVVDSSEAVQFRANNVTVTYGDVVGGYDTIYAVDFKDSDYAYIENNKIDAKGHTYIYGIILSGDNFNINTNTITTESDNYYANGIDIEGPATGVVYDNVIDVTGNQSVYGIYSGMNGENVSALYQNNTITGNAYNVFGMSLGDVESNVVNNSITLDGNYTTGIAYRGTSLTATGNHIVLTASEEGNETVSENFGVAARGIHVIMGNVTIANNTIATPGKGVSLAGNKTEATLEGNFINVVGNADKDAYAIYVDEIAKLEVNNNTVDYQGATAGNGINNAVYIYNTSDARIEGNTFTLDLVSSGVSWAEVPAGSGNWVSFPVSEGIVVDSSEAVQFRANNVTVTYGDVVGDYDTIYAVDFKNSDYALIENNKIDAKGHTYIYGIILSGDNFNINTNTITTESDNYYANGIDIEGPATGVVSDNVIDVTGNQSVYGIYSGMNGENVSALYQNNTITGNAYNVFGMSLGDVESNVVNNSITLDGNYTTGIAYRGTSLTATGNHIVLTASEEGNETVWENFGVEAVGIKVINGTTIIENNTISTPGKGVHVEGGKTDVYLYENFINVVGNDDQNAYAIFAIDASSLYVNSNAIDYQGATKGTGVNNAVYVNNVTLTTITQNNFTLDLVSCYVPWFEIPASSGNWVSFPISEGIVVEDSDAIFSLNKVDVIYGDAVGSYDTIYAVDFKCDNAIISENEINAKGHTYIYGLIITGENFTVEANNITTESDIYYANGIDIEGPATGVIKDNGIIAKGVTSAYPIYSGMNGQNVSVNYTGNDIVGDAYLVIGMSLGDVESNIVDSGITVTGNYTTGIAYRGSKLTVDNTQVSSMGSNVGDENVWESFGVETAGIKVVKGNSTITNNNVETTANYAVDVKDTAASVHDNYLVGKKFAGDESVDNAANAEVYNNTPVIENKTATLVTITEVSGDGNVAGVLTTDNGTAIADNVVTYSINGVNGTAKTDENGVFIIPVGNNEVSVLFEEDSYYTASNVASISLKDVAPVREDVNVNVTIGDIAIGNDTNVTVSVPNATGNVTVIVDGIPTVVALDENGTAVVPIENLTAGEHNVVVVYTGDDTHNAAYAIETFYLEAYDSDFANMTVDGDLNITATLVNALGDPIPNAVIAYSIGDVNGTVTTDENGLFSIIGENGKEITIEYAGNDIYLPNSISLTLKDLAPVRAATMFNVTAGTSIKTYAVDFGAGERGKNVAFRLTDADGNPIANATVNFAYKTTYFNRTTDENGIVEIGISTQFAGEYLCALSYLGDETHNATFVPFSFNIQYKTITITASAKTFKSTAKTKKYTVTLKTSPFNSKDGKAYLKAGKKVTLKINGKTYTAKTNAKGQATFNIKLTKKGKFTTKISFAGDNTYKAASKSVKITIK